MAWARKVGHKIQNFVTGSRSDDGSLESSQNQSTDSKVHREKLDLSGVAKVLVIGETGSGKSTFINYLTNYFHDGSLQNLKVAIPSRFHPIPTEKFAHCEQDIQNNTQSKTDDCNQYLFSTDSKQYLFIDTPGLSDTRGASQDDQNIMKIVDSVENLGGLTAVVIVVNGAVARLTLNLRNVLIRLRGNLPDIVMDNVILVLTNSTRYAANFTVGSLQMNGNIYPYYTQNSAFSQDPKSWTKSAIAALEMEFGQAMDEISNMIETIDTFKTKSVDAFKQMKSIRNEIKSLLHTARIEVSQIQMMQDEIAAFEAALSQTDNDLVTYNDYTIEREVDKVEIVDAPYHSTLCQHCNYICHDECGLDELTIAGSQMFQQCMAITNGLCTNCPHKCSYTAHYHAQKTVRNTKETLQDVLADIKAKYDQATTNKSNYQSQITSVEDAKRLLGNALKQKSEDIKQLCLQLHGLCSGFNLAEELMILISQLEVEGKLLKNIDAKQQADALVRSLKELCDAIAQDQNEATENLPQMKIINTERPVSGRVNQMAPLLPNDKQSSVRQNRLSPNSSGSHANESVLAALQAISARKKTGNDNTKRRGNPDRIRKSVDDKMNVKSNRNKKVNRSENYTSDSEEMSTKSEEHSNTDDDTDEDLIKSKKQHKKKGLSDDIDEEELKQLSIKELLARFRTYRNDRLKANFFIHELEQRSEGKSFGPLIEPAIRVAYTKSNQKYSTYPLHALNEEYDRLKKIVAGYIKPNIMKIDKVPPNILIDITVVYEFLQNQPLDVRSQLLDGTLYNQQPTLSPYPSASIGLSYPSSRSSTPQPSGWMPLQQHPNMVHHLNPSLNLPTPYPSHEQYYQSNSNPHQYGSAIHHPHTSLYPSYNNPMLSPHGNDMQPIKQPVPVIPSNLNSSFQDMRIGFKPIVNLDDNLQSEKRELINGDYALSSQYDIASCNDNVNDTGIMTNAQLVSTYKNSFSRGDYSRSQTCYSELKRRCYGEYPLLIQSNAVVFSEMWQKYQTFSIEELNNRKMHIQKLIDNSLANGDVTRIDEIPKELIIEAATLNRLIADQTTQIR